MHEYPCDPRIYHADLYRISNQEEFEELDLIDQSTDGILVVEWPEHAGDGLVKYNVDVCIYRPDPFDNLRMITIDSPDPNLSRIIRSLELNGTEYA